MQQCEALISLVQEGSFSRAARKMFLTQPALTKNIKNMENYLGVAVVFRSSSGIELTVEGKIIYEYAQRIIKLRGEAGDKILQLRDKRGGDIYLAASTIPATYILPHVLSKFYKEHSDIRVHVRAADSEEAVNMVLDKQVELGIVGKNPQNKKFIARPLWRDNLLLVIPQNHGWQRKKKITLDELIAEPFVIREKGSATRDILEESLKNSLSLNLAQLNVCAEMGSSEAVKEAVLTGLGVSVISAYAVAREMARKLLFAIPFPGFSIERNFYLIHQRRLEMTALQKMFVDFLKNFKPAKAI
jgi:DNA-binding transcriptional LysR family regulator